MNGTRTSSEFMRKRWTHGGRRQKRLNSHSRGSKAGSGQMAALAAVAVTVPRLVWVRSSKVYLRLGSLGTRGTHQADQP